MKPTIGQVQYPVSVKFLLNKQIQMNNENRSGKVKEKQAIKE